MRNALAAIISVSTIGLLVAMVPIPRFLSSDAPAIDVATSVTPVSRDPIQLLGRPERGAFRCTTVVRDALANKRVLALKELVVVPGQHAEGTETIDAFEIRFEGSVDTKSERAETRVRITRSGRVVGRQQTSTWLSRS